MIKQTENKYALDRVVLNLVESVRKQMKENEYIQNRSPLKEEDYIKISYEREIKPSNRKDTKEKKDKKRKVKHPTSKRKYWIINNKK